MNKLRVGIAGYGVVGQRRREFIDKHPNMQVVAICDRLLREEDQIFDGMAVYRSYHELIERGNLDILFVCLSNDLASEVTIAGLTAGLHVFCEKPPGRTVSEIKSVIECECKFPKLKLMYGFNHRYHSSIKEALKIIDSKEFGNIINIRGVYGKAKLITFNQPDWRTRREIAGGGVLLDQGIHMVDLMRLFGGEFTQAHSFISNSHWGYDVEDNAYAILRGDSGVVAMLNSSATQWRHRFNLDINLEKGSVILGGLLTGTKSYGAETLTIIRADPDNDRGDPMEYTTRYNKDSSWGDEIAVFADFILNDKPVNCSSSMDALKTMELVFKIYYADESWRAKYNIANPNKYE
jgi:predicted dehydrogenase